jgi:hypothetical protein
MNELYRSVFRSRVAAALGAAKAVAGITHQGVKGEIREVLVRELFRPLLPSDVSVGTGQIATTSGDLSAQQDVVIYDRKILPPVLFESVIGVFPIESVLATVEVKTKLTATELTSTYETAAAIHRYPYLSGENDATTGQPIVHPIGRVIASVFALGSDLTPGGKTELQRYQGIHRTGDSPLRAICVSGRGYWYFADGWRCVEPDGEHSETVAFIIGLFDALGVVGKTRRQPRLAGYIVKRQDEGAV